MGKVLRIKFPNNVDLCCDTCGKTSFALRMEESEFDNGAGAAFLICKGRGCDFRFRIYVDMQYFGGDE